jgi:hypothetical protein
MQSHSHVYIFILIALIIGLVGGYFYGSLQTSQAQYDAGYTTAMADAEARLVERGLIMQEPNVGGVTEGVGDMQGTQYYSGEVVRVSATTIAVQIPAMNPLMDDTVREFTIDSQTRITQQQEKPFEVFEEELQAWEAVLSTTNESTTENDIVSDEVMMAMPEPFTTTPASTSDITVGEYATIEADGTMAIAIALPPVFDDMMPETPDMTGLENETL